MLQNFRRSIYRLEYKFGRYAIHNLMAYITSTMLVVYIFQMITNFPLSNYLMLIRHYLFQGEIWRLITFVFVPPSSSNPFFLLISLYFYYMMGSSLERQWGAFKFNVYYLIGVVGIIIASLIGGFGSATFLNLSMFLVFAHLFPDTEFLLFFILPIKAKYMGYISWGLLLFQFIFSPFSQKLTIIFSLLNFILFFGDDFFKGIKEELKYRKTRQNYRRSMNNNNRR